MTRDTAASSPRPLAAPLAAPGTAVTRRRLLLGGLGLAGVGTLAACSGATGSSGPTALGSRTTLPASPPVSPSAGQKVIDLALNPRPVTVDLGGVTVNTWAYGEQVPGTPVRAKAGDLIRATVRNELPQPTSIHWHGIRLRDVADGVPGLTQAPIGAGASYQYAFTVPDPGTYFFHPHVGVQLDRGLYAPLIIEDPAERGDYDAEWVVVLDDWLDGTGRTPDQVLTQLKGGTGGTGGTGGMGGMDHSGMTGMDHSDMTGSTSNGSMGSMGSSPFGDAGDVTYPYYLANGRISTAPQTFTAKPGQKIRIRLINAASDTIFSVALSGHRMRVTHTDGYPVQPRTTDALYIGMGERYDVEITAKDGVFPLLAVPVGKTPAPGPAGGQAITLLRTGSGSPPPPTARPNELSGQTLMVHDLAPAESATLPPRTPDRTSTLTLNGQMNPYQWGINGAPYGSNSPVTITKGERLRMAVTNQTMMVHPLHVHGHTFALASTGVRKDTVLVRPMERLEVDIEADNAGRWMTHCHNAYHAEAGMMIELRYT